MMVPDYLPYISPISPLNLPYIFRGVSMMVPDHALIANPNPDPSPSPSPSPNPNQVDAASSRAAGVAR